MQEFPKVFDQIEFAVYCPPGDSRNYDVFHRTFCNRCIQKQEKCKGNSIFEGLTNLLKDLKGDEYGIIHHSEGHKGTMDDPIPMPYIAYSETVLKLIDAVYEFDKAHPEYDLKNYMEIMEKNGIKNMDEIRPEEYDAHVVMAVLMGIVRQEKFCDGAILSRLKNGMVQKLLQRLNNIDENDISEIEPRGKRKTVKRKIELLNASCTD